MTDQVLPILNVKDISKIESVKKMSSDFDNLIIASIRTFQNKCYELVFINNEEQDCLRFGEKIETVHKLESALNKKFMPLRFDDGICYGNF
jgi:hypothetical protein